MGELGKETYSVGLITHPQLTPLQCLKEIVYQLGGDRSSDDKAEVLHLLQDMLYANMESGKDTVVIIDEAQLIEGKPEERRPEKGQEFFVQTTKGAEDSESGQPAQPIHQGAAVRG